MNPEDKDKVKDKDIPPVGILNASPEPSNLTFSPQQVENEFFKQGLTDKDAEKFYNHYQSQGWKKGNGLPISDLSSQVTNWRLNPKQYEVKEDDAKATVRKAMQYAEESRNRREGNGTLAEIIPGSIESPGESIF